MIVLKAISSISIFLSSKVTSANVDSAALATFNCIRTTLIFLHQRRKYILPLMISTSIHIVIVQRTSNIHIKQIKQQKNYIAIERVKHKIDTKIIERKTIFTENKRFTQNSHISNIIKDRQTQSPKEINKCF